MKDKQIENFIRTQKDLLENDELDILYNNYLHNDSDVISTHELTEWINGKTDEKNNERIELPKDRYNDDFEDLGEDIHSYLEENKIYTIDGLKGVLFHSTGRKIESQLSKEDRKQLLNIVFSRKYFHRSIEAIIKVEYFATTTPFGNFTESYLLDVINETITHQTTINGKAEIDETISIERIDYFNMVYRISETRYIEDGPLFDALNADLKITRVSGKVEEFHGFVKPDIALELNKILEESKKL